MKFAQEQQPIALAAIGLSVAFGLHALMRFMARDATKKSDFKYLQPKSTLPIIGNTLDVMAFHGDRLYDWMADQCVASKSSPWLFIISGRPPAVMLSTPELFEDVLKTQFESFERGNIDYFSDLFGKGILASDGDEWYFHRKTASNLFSNQMMRDVMYEAVREKALRLRKVLRVYESRGEPASFKSVITHFTSDVFGKIGFGVDLQCLENGLDGTKGNEFVEAFATSTRMMYFRFMQPSWLWKLKKHLNISTERENTASREVIDEFIFRVINESIAKKETESKASPSSNDASAPSPKDLISLFLSSTIKEDEDLKGKAFDSEMHLIRDTVVNFIFAGKDTSSHSMSFFIVMMNRYPEVPEKIREELRAKLPRSPSGEFQVPSMDDLPQLTYLEAAIRENLRLNPVAPLVPRVATTDVVLCDGTPLPKGNNVGLLVYASGRMKSVWGEDALEFKPERWIDPDTGKLISVSPFKFTPFLAGRRSCIGMKFAMMEIKCTLAVLLSKFDFQTTEDPWKITYETALTMTVKGSLAVKISSLVDGGGLRALAESAWS
ncbi:Cytochrome p450 [Globisporangium polare]